MIVHCSEYPLIVYRSLKHWGHINPFLLLDYRQGSAAKELWCSIWRHCRNNPEKFNSPVFIRDKIIQRSSDLKHTSIFPCPIILIPLYSEDLLKIMIMHKIIEGFGLGATFKIKYLQHSWHVCLYTAGTITNTISCNLAFFCSSCAEFISRAFGKGWDSQKSLTPTVHCCSNTELETSLKGNCVPSPKP